MSRLLTELYRLLHVHSIRTSPYHPQTDGLVEWFNQTLKAIQGQVLKSKGVMQGDPLAMSMYALGIRPLIHKLKDTKQVWFADDAAANDSLVNLHVWWSTLLKQGPSFGYYPNPAKTWFIVKEDNLDQATNIFGSSEVNITFSGQKHLGAALGSTEFVKKYVKKKVGEWCEGVTTYLPLQKENHKLHTLPSYMTWSKPLLELCPTDNTKHHRTPDSLRRSHPTLVDPCNHWPKHNVRHRMGCLSATLLPWRTGNNKSGEVISAP